MKIALFVHCFFPTHFYGTETYTLDLARNLIDLGHEVTVVSAIFCGEPRAGAPVTRYHHQGVPVVCIDKNAHPHGRVKETYYQPEMAPVLREILEALQPDIVHVTHLINHTAVLLEVTAALGIPALATLTDFFGFCFNNKLEDYRGDLCRGPNKSRSNCLACFLSAVASGPRGKRLPRWLKHGRPLRVAATGLSLVRHVPVLRRGPTGGLVEDIRRRPDILKACYAHYSCVITPTAFLRDAYLANGLSRPTHNMWFGVDVPRSAKPARAPAARLKIGYIGQIAHHKGVDILIEAFAGMGDAPADLVIYGSPDQDPHYMARLRHLTGTAAVEFPGTFAPERMSGIMASLDVLVIPSRWYENSPLVLLNALASHTPTVVSRVAGLTEFVDDGVNGFAFERGSVADLRRVLGQFITQPGLAAQLAATTHFDRTTRTMTEDVVRVYQSVLN